MSTTRSASLATALVFLALSSAVLASEPSAPAAGATATPAPAASPAAADASPVATPAAARPLNHLEKRAVAMLEIRTSKYIYNCRGRLAPKKTGKVVVELTLLPDGSVTGEKIASSTLEHPATEACILTAIRKQAPKLKSDPTRPPVPLTWTYDFKAH